MTDMTKEEKIKEAWGELWNSFNESAKKCALNKDGYVASILQNGLNRDFTEFNTALVAWRPKSLQGIEDNNGWIKIESEDDLPKEDMDCFYITKYSENIISGCFRLHSYKGWRNMFTVDHIIAVGLGHVTHYQPIVKPKPPIY